MNPSRGLDAFALPIYEPIFLINTYGQLLWKALFSPHDALQPVQYEAHYLFGMSAAFLAAWRMALYRIAAFCRFSQSASSDVCLWRIRTHAAPYRSSDAEPTGSSEPPDCVSGVFMRQWPAVAEPER